MIHYQLRFEADSREIIRSLPPSLKAGVRQALRLMILDPESGKPLQGKLAGLWRWQVGRLRIVYEINRSRKVLSVVKIGPRRTIYIEMELERLHKAGRH